MQDRVSDYIEQFGISEAEMLGQIRDIILSAHPAIQENFTYGVPFYKYQKNLIYFCYNKKRNRFVLGFVEGHRMIDPHHLLRADDNQKFIRHLVLQPQNTDLTVIAEYVQLAVEAQIFT